MFRNILQSELVQQAFDDFPIYVLDIADQKKIVMANLMAQRPQLLMAGTIPMNLNLFVSVRMKMRV